jgi:hypothetical protein
MRPEVLALHQAPLQLSWHGFPGPLRRSPTEPFVRSFRQALLEYSPHLTRSVGRHSSEGCAARCSTASRAGRTRSVRVRTSARASARARAGTMNAKFITHYVSDQAGYPPPPLPPSLPPARSPLKPPAPSAQPQPHPPRGTTPEYAPSLARLFVCARGCLRAAVRSSALGRSGDVAAGLRVALQRGPHLHARLLPRQVRTPVA